jgi:anti-sigma-K factor RskA
MMTLHEEVDELIAAYSLGAVSEAEAAMVRHHLPSCAECQETLARMTEVVAVLPLSLEEVAPPEGLRERLLVSAAGEPRGMTAAPGSDGPIDERTAPRPAPGTSRLPFLRRLPNWALVAAAVVLVALFGWNVGLQTRKTTPPPTTAIHATLLDGRHRDVGTVTYLKDQRVALVSLHSLSAPGPGKNYELWVIPAGGKPVPGGVFLPDPNGSRVMAVSWAIKHGDIIAVTEEPPGGVPQPTGKVEISAQI